MEKKEILTEENYLKGKKKIKSIALIVLTIGLLLGGSLIITGIVKQNAVNEKYSEENKAKELQQLESEKQQLSNQVEEEKQNLIKSKEDLEAKIKPIEDEIKNLKRVTFTGFDDAYYARQDKIEELNESIAVDKKSIDVIENALDESFDHCAFDSAKNNNYTSSYCSLKNELKAKNGEIYLLDNKYTDFNKKFESEKYVPFYIVGGFILIVSIMISGSIYMMTKRREIAAFSAQQMMPIAQEGIEKMAPSVGKAGASIAKEMAPTYGQIAKEISKGIKEGLKGEEKKEKK
ncbi:MAG: hypothetical protein PUD07_03105 [bacterium]|nr:hypothetical protein [bacterium]